VPAHNNTLPPLDSDQLDQDTVAALAAKVSALPPLTDDQCESIADLFVQIRVSGAKR